jgi:hypothetical protein
MIETTDVFAREITNLHDAERMSCNLTLNIAFVLQASDSWVESFSRRAWANPNNLIRTQKRGA